MDLKHSFKQLRYGIFIGDAYGVFFTLLVKIFGDLMRPSIYVAKGCSAIYVTTTTHASMIAIFRIFLLVSRLTAMLVR